MRDNTTKNKITKKTRFDDGVHPSWATSLGPFPTVISLFINLKCQNYNEMDLQIPNLKSLFNYVAQPQKQRLLLNSSRNSEKNEYKLDYILNWPLMTLFGMQNNAL
jgi:hypothetical protein